MKDHHWLQGETFTFPPEWRIVEVREGRYELVRADEPDNAKAAGSKGAVEAVQRLFTNVP